MGPLQQVVFWWAYCEVSSIPCPTFWVDCGDFGICGGVCVEMVRMLNCLEKELSEFFQIMHYVLSENVVYVVVDGFVTKKYIGHDLENEVGKL